MSACSSGSRYGDGRSIDCISPLLYRQSRAIVPLTAVTRHGGLCAREDIRAARSVPDRIRVQVSDAPIANVEDGERSVNEKRNILTNSKRAPGVAFSAVPVCGRSVGGQRRGRLDASARERSPRRTVAVMVQCALYSSFGPHLRG